MNQMFNPLLHKLVEHAEHQALFWWKPKDGRVNMGDYLSKIIVAMVLQMRDLDLLEKKPGRGRLIAIGSVLHFANTGDTVWGSGINGKIPETMLTFQDLDVRAVRGPGTREKLQARGIKVPDVYGDPGLLMPKFFPADTLGAATKRPYVVVRHFNEPAEKYAGYEHCLVSPDCKPAAFVSQILGAELVVSSSLHGLILAEAYGIPAVYLDWGNGEDRFKYDDYYHGTGRSTWHSGTSIEECVALGGNAAFDLGRIQSGLLAAFPYDLW